jgi:hypothetical protein
MERTIPTAGRKTGKNDGREYPRLSSLSSDKWSYTFPLQLRRIEPAEFYSVILCNPVGDSLQEKSPLNAARLPMIALRRTQVP